MAESVSKEHYPKVDLGDLKMKERQKTLHVMQLFGHKSIRNIFMYTQLVDFKEDDFASLALPTQNKKPAHS
jgi:hypothetical protein